ncbi:hypothetical protein QBC46DRAFT_462621 [Diplogelasinospora grovesii]|uniref:Zn(2)-C6 fungal-type domain-containing protein n=1 Tax=Diplogelasinospora grovesii TaxID=303347 RepID=A0AAN6MW65_9PEZI|nr:hypothetical protein QBC46DRAFT_462621 [Diplogelasinospora grovesii]
MRRAHRKSRYGCRECKQRHIKCDESRPCCVNCSTLGRRCSYLTTAVSTSKPPLGRHPPGSSPESAPSSSLPSPRSEAGPVISLSPQQQLTGQVFSLQHLELLHHFETDMAEAMAVGEPLVNSDFLKVTVRQAFSTPYLLDQLLALSAAHMSVLRPDRQQFYRDQATQLQTRALGSFNAVRAEVSDDNCLGMFLFSTFLGHHAIFEIHSSRGDLQTLLDKFVVCLGLHRGIRAIAGQAWPMIQAQIQPLTSAGFGIDPAVFSGDNGTVVNECAGLMELLSAAELSSSSIQACRQAAKALQSALHIQRTPGASPSRRVNAALAWPVLVPVDFVNLLDQRCPEALVILAFYAVLLHNARDYWAFGDTGEILLRSITDHLGPYWAKWLAWPNEVLGIMAEART